MSDALLPRKDPAIGPGSRPQDSGIAIRRSLVGPTRFAMGLLLCHIVLEYLRPQTFWPPLGALQLPGVALALLLIVTIPRVLNGSARIAGQTWLLLGFVALSGLSALYAANWFRAYKFTYAVAVTMIGFLAIAYLLRDPRDFKKLLAVLVVIHVYLSFGGILAFLHTQYNDVGYASTGYVGGGFLKDENDFALAINVILPFALYLAVQARSGVPRLLWRGASAVLVLTSVFTFSRGGFVGLAAMAIYWVIISQRRQLAILALISGIILVAVVAPPQYWDRISTIAATDQGTAWERQSLWAAARGMFYDSPIWGVGANNFGIHVPNYGLDFAPEMRENLWGKAVHSMYFQLLAEFGIVGVVLIGSTLVLNFRCLSQVVRLSKRGDVVASLGLLASSLQASWVGFLVSATFLSVLDFPHLYYLTGLTVASHRMAVEQARGENPTGLR